MLAKRLVGQLSASDDYEESMFLKLKVNHKHSSSANPFFDKTKVACGVEYTSKLQQMLQDISISKDLLKSYKSCCENKQQGDTSISSK